MKSAYELAMERFDDDDGPKLTDEQKKQLEEIDIKFKAKIAEREVFLNKTLEAERAAGNMDEAEKIAAQLRSEKAVLEEDMEREKDKIRQSR